MSPPSPAVRAVQLRLLRCRGEARDGVLRIPPGGCGLAGLLAFDHGACGPSAAVHRCRVEPSDSFFRLVNHGARIVCAVNGVRVGSACEHALALGDRIEIGLLCLCLEAATCADDRSADRVLAMPSASNEHTRSEWLALVSSDSPGLPARAEQGDPFAMLGLRAEAWLGPKARPSGSDRSTPVEGADLAAALLDRLNDEFARVVRDPNRLVGSPTWAEQPTTERTGLPTLAELSASALAFPRLRDVLQKREAVATVLDRFAPPDDGSDWCRPSARPDILRLFAPEARAATPVLPDLTRRQHHRVSLDSRVHLDVTIRASSATGVTSPGCSPSIRDSRHGRTHQDGVDPIPGSGPPDPLR